MKKIIIGNRYGRFGNTLYRLSNILAFAIENNVTVWDRSLHQTNYSRLFPRIKNRLLLSYPKSVILPFSCYHLHRAQAKIIKSVGYNKKLWSTPTRNSGTEFYLEKRSLFDSNRNTVILNGFDYNADAYVRRQAPFLRHLFTPHKPIVKLARNQLLKLKKEDNLLIAVHIRRTDFKSWENGKYYFELDYYAQAMRNATKVFKDKKITFVIFSDDSKIKSSCFPNINCISFPELSSISFDWFFMSLCNFIIAPLYSTFSGWASFYGEVPIFKLNGKNLPQASSDFFFDSVLNNSRRYNKSFEANIVS